MVMPFCIGCHTRKPCAQGERLRSAVRGLAEIPASDGYKGNEHEAARRQMFRRVDNIVLVFESFADFPPSAASVEGDALGCFRDERDVAGSLKVERYFHFIFLSALSMKQILRLFTPVNTRDKP